MSRYKWLVFFAVILLPKLASAQSMRLQGAAFGSVVQIGSLNFVKIGENKYMQSSAVTCPHGAKVGSQWVKCVDSEEDLDGGGDCDGNCVDGSSYGVKYTQMCLTCTAGYQYTTTYNDCTLTCGEHSSNSDADTCSCESGWTYSGGKSSYTVVGGACDQQCPTGTMYSETYKTCLTINAYACNHPIGFLQEWDNCDSLGTYTGTNASDIICLMDERDGKTYEIRKFADGLCWMVTNLAYGGDINGGAVASDQCYNRHEFTSANGSNQNLNRFGPGTYGDCMSPYSSATDDVINGTQKYWGYYYNKAAAVQDGTICYGCSNTGLSDPIVGLCPDGWYIPTNTENKGGYKYLYAITGLGETFWNETWKGVLAGGVQRGGGLYNQGTYGIYWGSVNSNQNMWVQINHDAWWNGNIGSADSSGISIRCIKSW